MADTNQDPLDNTDAEAIFFQNGGLEDCGGRCPGDDGQCKNPCTKLHGHAGSCRCSTYGEY